MDSAFPDLEGLRMDVDLPNPFVFTDGGRVATQQDWSARREELLRLYLHYAFGHAPPAPKGVQWNALSTSAELESGIVSMGPESILELRAQIAFPRADDDRFPVLINTCGEFGESRGTDEALGRGYAVCEWMRRDIDAGDADSMGGVRSLYPDFDWATLAAWAWGVQRVVDALAQNRRIDPNRICLTGHSAAGKAALLAGALDQRIALVSANASGLGGAAPFRFPAEGSEDLEALAAFPQRAQWFHPRLLQFAGQEALLPFDQHHLKALIAPRPLLCTESSDDASANPKGSQWTHMAAREVYRFLEAESRIGLNYRTGPHAHMLEDWEATLEFADRHLFGRSGTRNFHALPFTDPVLVHSWPAPAIPGPVLDPNKEEQEQAPPHPGDALWIRPPAQPGGDYHITWNDEIFAVEEIKLYDDQGFPVNWFEVGGVAGSQGVRWNGRDASEKRLEPGLYLLRAYSRHRPVLARHFEVPDSDYPVPASRER